MFAFNEETNTVPDEKITKTTRVVNYSGNSYGKKTADDKEDAPKEKVEKVVTGEVIQRKKGMGRRIADTFTGEDFGSVRQYVIFDVAVPALKSLISDMVSQGIERTLFGDSRPRGGGGSGARVSYNRMYGGGNTRRDESRRPAMSQRGRATHDFAEIIIGTRAEAETVLDTLIECLDKYDVVTVAELYDAVGITGSFSDDKWGWNDLRQAGVRRVRDGYLLELPAPMVLD